MGRQDTSQTLYLKTVFFVKRPFSKVRYPAGSQACHLWRGTFISHPFDVALESFCVALYYMKEGSIFTALDALRGGGAPSPSELQGEAGSMNSPLEYPVCPPHRNCFFFKIHF